VYYEGIKMRLLPSFLLFALFIFTISCGNDNVIDTSQVPSSGGGGTSTGQIGTLNSNNLATMYAKYPCSGGRIAEMYFTSTSASINGSNIQANWQTGTTNGSLVDKSRYVGFSSYNDIMVFEKVSTSSGTTAFNIILSFCEFSSLLTPGRSYSNFTTPSGISVADNLNCSTNNIISSNTMLTAAPYGSAPSTYVNTIFTLSTNQSLCPL
jgi:hypothetical protein